MTALPVQDLLSVIRVCRHLRASLCEASSLWTRVDAIDKPSTLRFVLERTKGLPVSITGLYLDQTGDDLLQVVASHMWHVRALGLYVHTPRIIREPIPEGTNAYTLFTSPAPLLQRIAFSRVARPTGDVSLAAQDTFIPHANPLFGGVTPLLDALYARDVPTSSLFTGSLANPQCLKTITRRLQTDKFCKASFIWKYAHTFHHTTFNIELDGWAPGDSPREIAPSLRRINIHWRALGPLVPDEVIPTNECWKLVPIVHVTHVGDTTLSGVTNINVTAPISIPATSVPYSSVQVRSSITGDPCVNVRAVDVEGRERSFCGLQSATVTGLLSRIPADRLSTITVTTAAVALNALSNAQLPTLQCMRLVSNRSETGWVDTFAHDILNVRTLERIEFSVEGNPKTVGWTTKTILRILSSCMAAGCTLEKVVFLGFQPEARCVSLAATFAEEIIVDQNWREPLEERIWFTQPSFEWM